MKTLDAAKHITLILLAGLCLSSIVGIGTAVAAQRSGPAAWVEEYWDVKPEKFDEFIASYKKNVYELTRQVPGYRGYTFMTLIPDQNGEPTPPNEPDNLLTPHYGVHLQGQILIERAVDIGKLMRQTHNVVIVHNLQNWDDARAFRQNVEQIYAKENNGGNYAEHLAQTLYPLANNYWETNFRLMETGLEMKEEMRSGKDADGLNLDPHPSSDVWMKEYFEVTAEELDAFMSAYKNNTLVVMAPIEGYQGVTVVTSLPPNNAEAARTGYNGREELGGPPQFYIPQPGVMLDGSIRTDTSINYSLMFKPTFTLITYYQMVPGTDLLKVMQENFERDHPGVARLPYITKVLFPHAQNHWDMRYRAIETSFVPGSE